MILSPLFFPKKKKNLEEETNLRWLIREMAGGIYWWRDQLYDTQDKLQY
jgi:hypothetical protein